MRMHTFEGIFWLCAGLLICAFAWQFNMGVLSEPGPGALPFGLGLILIGLSIIYLLRGLVARVTELEQPLPVGPRWPRILVIFFYMGLVTFLFESLGYLLSIFLLIAIIMFVMEPRRWASALLFGAVSSAASYTLFDIWLKVPMPKGILLFLG